MINKPPPFKGLNIRIPIIISIKGRGFIDQGSTLLGGGDRKAMPATTTMGEPVYLPPITAPAEAWEFHR